MDMEDLIRYTRHQKNPRSHHGTYRHVAYRLALLRMMLRALPHRRAFLAAALVLCIVVLVSGIALLWALIPFAAQALGHVEANGIKGVVDSVLPLAERIWTGNK